MLQYSHCFVTYSVKGFGSVYVLHKAVPVPVQRSAFNATPVPVHRPFTIFMRYNYSASSDSRQCTVQTISHKGLDVS